jgi:regulator of replication initiation timing
MITDQDAVIRALKQQMTELQSRTSDLTSMKKELAAMSKENARLTSENKKLTDSLTTSQNESKTLSNKLAAARSSQAPETKNVPGSAVKPRSNGIVLPGTAEAAKEALLAKQKVDLYSDLTNLVILGMKRNEDEEDVYDCLQTGRNGSTLTCNPISFVQFANSWLQLSISTSQSPPQVTRPTKTPNSYTSPCSTSSATRSCWICYPTT